jgi:hypothetical protein
MLSFVTYSQAQGAAGLKPGPGGSKASGWDGFAGVTVRLVRPLLEGFGIVATTPAVEFLGARRPSSTWGLRARRR